MKWVQIFLVVTLGALGYYYHSSWQSFAGGLSTNFLRETKREKEVRRVFANYADLISRGDPGSENVYLPEARVLRTSSDSEGRRRQASETAADHRAASLTLLPKFKSGQWKIRFADLHFRELQDGKVRATFATYLNDGPADQVSMFFVNTAPHRWAVVEEVHESVP